MKNYLIVALMCLVVALSIGVKPLQRAITEATKLGTLSGAEACVKYSKGELLSEEAVRSACVSTFQKPLFLPDLATGRAGPRLGGQTVSWGGTLQNKTPDHVTTWIRVSVVIYDHEGSKQEFEGETPIWIAPLGDAEFKVELPELKPEQLSNIQFCKSEDEVPKSCMTWGISGVMGLEF